jgi:hypothetical protein
MKLEKHTILYRKDERGVILESGVFGPDDEVPEGFEPKVGYERLQQARVVEHSIAESKLTPWETVTGDTEAGEVSDEVKDALDDGTPRQAMEAAGVDLSEADKEADEALEAERKSLADAAKADAEQKAEEIDSGSPLQARQEADVELTEAEQEAQEAAEAGPEAEPEADEKAEPKKAESSGQRRKASNKN